MGNAANAEQVERLRDRERDDLRALVIAAQQVLDTYPGRLWTNYIIENICRISMDPFHPESHIHANNAGRQAVGREIKDFITHQLGVATLKKLTDQRYEALNEELLIRSATETP